MGCAESISVPVLRAALAAVPLSAWSLPSTHEATNVHHGYRRVVLADLAEPFAFVLEQFEPVRDAWLSWIDPGGFIVPHRDAGPYYERWQVPISTAGWMQQDSAQAAEDGLPFCVEHWHPHSVRNPSDQPRVHLVIDRDIVANPALDPFCIFDKEPANG